MDKELASAAKSLGIPPGKNVNASMGEIARKMKGVKAGEAGQIGLSAYFLEKGKKQEAGSQKKVAGPKGAATCPVSGWRVYVFPERVDAGCGLSGGVALSAEHSGDAFALGSVVVFAAHEGEDADRGAGVEFV